MLQILLASAWLAGAVSDAAEADPVDVFSEDVAHFARLIQSPLPERRVEGVQGLSYLKHWPSEDALIKLLGDPSPVIRRETVQALGRLGSSKSVPHLMRLLEDPSWELRQNAGLELRRLTGMNLPAGERTPWETWWNNGAVTNHEGMLLAAITNANPALPRAAALRALPHFASSASEEVLARLLPLPGLTLEERDFVAEAMERVGTPKVVPLLAGYHTDAAAWALGRIGGPDAGRALLNFRPTLVVLVNLDRLHSTHAGPLVPYLVSQMGLVTYRSQPDDLMNAAAQPIQRVGANLIRRSGFAPLLLELVLQELEDSMNPPIAHGPRPESPPGWQPMLERMRQELKPGFVRDDGVTTSQPLAALYHVATDKTLVPRLKSLLRHPAFVPRIYVAMTLGKLQARETLAEILALIREGYPFSDATALASGKHFDQSQTVRWRGFLCMALGRMGGPEARQALEALASDPNQPRDIRYGSVVGLRFLGSPQSLPVLDAISTNDIIWIVRDEARRTAAEIALRSKEGSG